MVAEEFGYTTIKNENNNRKDFTTTPYYIEDIASLSFQENIHLTPVQKFYDGANIFITGSTGFLGKILVEKLLRSCPTISTVYLLVRNKKGKNLEERVDEMFDDIIFDRLKKECPKFRHKVIGIPGDCVLPELGLSEQDKQILIDRINIVFHVAATVRFDEKMKIAVSINIRSTRDLLRLAKQMPHLKVCMHVSTIYSNCPNSYIEEKLYPPAIEGNKLIMLAENLSEEILDAIAPQLVGKYPNTYTFTKQIAEDIVRQETENMPVSIFRPAIVLSTYKEPIPSWINNLYGPTGVIAGVGVGLMRALHCDAKANANLVPVDMCVNSLIVAAWEVAENFQKSVEEHKPSDIAVYNYGSSEDQPITWGQFMHFAHLHGLSFPSMKAIWYYSFAVYKYFPIYLLCIFFLHTLPAIIADGVLFCLGKKPRMMSAYKKIHKFAGVIAFFATNEWKVQSDKIRQQQKNMSVEDRQLFFCNLKELNWDEFYKTYCTGVRIYLLQDPLDTLDKAKIRWRRLYYAHQIVKGLIVIALFWISHLLLKLFFGNIL